MSTHSPDCECDTYGCQLRRKSVGVAPSATPSRHNRRATQTPASAYNATIKGETRADGSFMPYLNPDLSPVRAKQFEMQNQGRKLRDIRKRQLATTNNTGG